MMSQGRRTQDTGKLFLQRWARLAMGHHSSGTGKRKMTPPSKEMEGLFASLMEDLPGAEKRRMFGCPCAFAGGNMYAGVVENRMMLRLSEKDRKEFLDLKGAKPFKAMPGRVMREYVEVPPSMLSGDPHLAHWIERSYGYADSLPPKPPRSKRNSRARGEGA